VVETSYEPMEGDTYGKKDEEDEEESLILACLKRQGGSTKV